ncbi:MAG: carboxy terminal-processing peptidase [Bacteriovorax sp.]|jgi:carboxyl-terminal processing protease|nr:carboxy terminal-processing peptidase [Bacteriovorax sp.]
MKRLLLPVLTLLFASSSFFLFPVHAKEAAKETRDPRREKLIGNILKNALETYHYRALKINDEVSQKAFSQYLKKIDGSKQFLTKGDVKDLESFQFAMDDEMVNGNYVLVEKALDLFKKRTALAENVRKEAFKKQFDFNGSENVEVDPDKRDWAKDELTLKENWKLIFKQATLNKYLSLIDEQSDKPSKSLKSPKPKSQKKLPPVKKLSDAEMRSKAHDSVSKRFKKIFDRLAKEDRDDQLDNFYNSITAVFDPHTTYLPAKKKEDFDIDITGKLEGIGAVLQEDGSYIKVVQIVPGGPAWRQKDLETDDTILAVSQGAGESVDLTDMKVDDAVRYIRGKKGTEVRLTVKKVDGTRKIISIIRDEIEVAASFAKSSVLQYKDSDAKVGYIQLPKFYRDFENSQINCTDDVKKELERLKKANVDAVVLDLRNNGGGALEDAKLMSGLFIGKGPVVQVKDHTGKIEVLENDDPSVFYDGPLIVLINRFSASASEILAGAMQDYGRAIVIGGDYSHGKGTVQAVLNLNQGPLLSMFGPTMGALKVTIQKFYRVTGASTQYKGVTSDIVLPDLFSYVESREKDLEYSLPWDQIQTKPFGKWNRFSYNLPQLREKSAARVKLNPRFNKIVKNVDYLNKKKKDTLVSLNLKQVQAEDIQNKKMAEELKMDEEDKNLMVTNFEDSLKAHENIRPGDMKKWTKDFEQRKEEWIKSLRQDVVLEESVMVANDILKTIKSKKTAQK